MLWLYYKHISFQLAVSMDIVACGHTVEISDQPNEYIFQQPGHYLCVCKADHIVSLLNYIHNIQKTNNKAELLGY